MAADSRRRGNGLDGDRKRGESEDSLCEHGLSIEGRGVLERLVEVRLLEYPESSTVESSLPRMAYIPPQSALCLLRLWMRMDIGLERRG